MTISKVLLVDDEPDLRRLAEFSLRKVGRWEVLACAGGTEALARARTERPDLVLLDLLMPAPDGRATLQALRAEPATRHIPVVIMTAGLTPETAAELQALGALAAVSKPFDPLGLPGLLARLVEQGGQP
jgi:CheY-like chemotaxis protein